MNTSLRARRGLLLLTVGALSVAALLAACSSEDDGPPSVVGADASFDTASRPGLDGSGGFEAGPTIDSALPQDAGADGAEGCPSSCSEGCAPDASTCILPLSVSAGADRNIAEDASTSLLAAVTGGLEPYGYAWRPTESLDDAAVPSPQASPRSTTEYTVSVTDSRGRVATDAVLVKVPDAPLVLVSWTTVQFPFGSQGPGNWAVQPNEVSVVQRNNSDPSAFVSDIQFAPVDVTGRFTPGSSSSSDDDFIGFVFGYQDKEHFYLFDWKKGTQASCGVTASVGMSVKRIDGSVDGGVSGVDGGALACRDLWASAGTVNTTVLSPASANPVTWGYNRSYDFHLIHTATSYFIEIREVGTDGGSNVIATLSGNDNRYPVGRFGFYNYSQDNVRYEFFRAKDPSATP